MKRLSLLLAISYPCVVHAAIVSGSELLTVLAVAILGTLLLAPGLRAGNPVAWITAPFLAMGIVWLLHAHIGWLPLYVYAPPVLINFFVAWIFGRTLLAGRTPLIERLVRLLHEPDAALDPAILIYARRLTLTWAVLLSGLGLASLWLALYATPRTWSLFANLLSYLIVGGFFLAEYAYRQRRFPQQPYRNIFDFMRRTAIAWQRTAQF